MIAINPLAGLHRIGNAEVSLAEWRKQALSLQEEFGREHSFVQAKIKALLEEIENLCDDLGD
jgi:hypothetical protein